ncbi:MAG: ATP-binding protein [Oscillospiraceae bacterium]|nr:ATP-binding protein [Oscillospiraceae bacterium]
MQEHLKQEVSACFNAPGREQREAAKQMLFTSACTHAKANTQAKKDTIRQYLEAFLDIVEHFFLEQVGEKTWFLCGRTVDETAQAVEAFLQQHTDQITEILHYHNSFAEYIDNLQPQGNSRNLFHYRNTDLGFYGRESEMEALDSFLEQEGQILWMAVVGDGGVGKSKLLYHFCAQVSNRPDWKTVWFSKNICERVNEYQNWAYPDRLLIVADYAGEMAKQLGDWLGKLAEINPSCRPKQLRLILLERENLGEVAPVWYQAFTGGREQRQAVEQFCVNLSSPCIELHGLGDEALKAMVMDYAHSKNRELLETNLTFVLEKAHEIDLNNLAPRPLVTLFIADAALEGKAYTHWNITALVENIISRYRNHWKVSVCDNNEERYESLYQMLVYATATGGWDLQVLPAPLETASRTLLASRQVLEPLVCAVNEEPTFRERLSPLEPDLVGEFFVLDYFNDKYYDKTTLAAIVQLFWGRRENFWSFLNRCIQNYYNEPRFQALFSSGLAAFEPETEDTSIVILFAKLLVNLTHCQSESEAVQTVDKLKALTGKFHDFPDFALVYSYGLVNLSSK